MFQFVCAFWKGLCQFWTGLAKMVCSDHHTHRGAPGPLHPRGNHAGSNSANSRGQTARQEGGRLRWKIWPPPTTLATNVSCCRSMLHGANCSVYMSLNGVLHRFQRGFRFKSPRMGLFVGLSIIATEAYIGVVTLASENMENVTDSSAGAVSSREQEAMQQANVDLNRVFGQLMREAGLASRMPRWRAYSYGSTWFCWNTEPFSICKDQPRPWAAWRYRHNKQKGTWKRVGKTVWFASRKKAKARADKWCTNVSHRSMVAELS